MDESSSAFFGPSSKGYVQPPSRRTYAAIWTTAEASRRHLGGNAWAQFPPEGSAFFFSLPSRRAEDAVAAGTRRQAEVNGGET